MGSTSCRTELVSLRPKISPTPFFFVTTALELRRAAKQSTPGTRSLCPFVGRSAIGERPMPERAIISYRWGPSFRLPLFSRSPARPPVRPSAVAKQLIIKVSCLLPHFPPTRIHSLSHSLSLAEKLLNSCCHARQRTVLKVAEPLLSPSSENRAFHSDSGKCRLLQLSLQHICQNCSAAICVSLLSLVSDSHSFGLFYLSSVVSVLLLAGFLSVPEECLPLLSFFFSFLFCNRFCRGVLLKSTPDSPPVSVRKRMSLHSVSGKKFLVCMCARTNLSLSRLGRYCALAVCFWLASRCMYCDLVQIHCIIFLISSSMLFSLMDAQSLVAFLYFCIQSFEDIV